MVVYCGRSLKAVNLRAKDKVFFFFLILVFLNCCLVGFIEVIVFER